MALRAAEMLKKCVPADIGRRASKPRADRQLTLWRGALDSPPENASAGTRAVPALACWSVIRYVSAMKNEDQKPKRGRPVERDWPESIPDSPENIARALMGSAPKDEEDWEYLKKHKKRKKE